MSQRSPSEMVFELGCLTKAFEVDLLAQKDRSACMSRDRLGAKQGIVCELGRFKRPSGVLHR